jgi:CDP-diacylglycerol pyrophosphatase
MHDNQLGRVLRAFLGSASVLGLCLPSAALASGFATRNALWHVVEDICLPMDHALGLSFPCLKVDSQRGFVVIRAPGDDTRIIVVPTARIRGIESPEILREDSPNFWAFAWAERDRVIARAPQPLGWNDLGMAINSSASRTQDQLHIHVDCVNARVKKALGAAKRLSKTWSTLDFRPFAGRYRAKRIEAVELGRSVFQMVASEIPGAHKRMGMQSIAVIGFVGADDDRGFVVLVNGNGGHAEELLDHQCSKSG